MDRYKIIAACKTADACLQAVCFVFMVSCLWASARFEVHRMAVLIMACFQVGTAVLWLLVLAREPAKVKGGHIIRILFMLVPLLLVLLYSSSYDGALLLYVACVMMFAGPVLGLSYFFITLKEISFYRRLGRQKEE